MKIEKTHNNQKIILVFVFTVSVFISILFLTFFKNTGPEEHKTPGTDYLVFYAPTAESLIHKQGIPIENEIGTRYPIGYPAFLAPIFYLSSLLRIDKLDLIVLVNIIISAVSICVLFLIAKIITNKKIALLATILWATYPFNLWLIKNPNSEIPFILFLYLSIFLYIKSAQQTSALKAFFAGLLIGITALVRPIAIVLPVVFAGLFFILLKKQSFKKKLTLSIFILLGYCIAVLPWVLCLYISTGKLLPLSTNGPVAIKGGMEMLIIPGSNGDIIQLPQDVTILIQKLNTVEYNTADLIKFLAQSLIDQPITLLKLISIKMARSWYATSEFWLENSILIVQIPYLASALFGIIVLWKKIKNKTALKIIITNIIYFWAFTALVLSILRYMIPVMGLLMIYSAFTLYFIFVKIRKLCVCCS